MPCAHATRSSTGTNSPSASARTGEGIADVLGLRLRGFLGWFVTRTYHLYQLPLFTRKLRVVVDWTVALFFRRDIAELGKLGHPTPLRDED